MAVILLAIDGSEHSERAFEFYMSNIHREGNELLLTHGIEYPYIPGEPYVRGEIVQDIFNQAKADGQKIMDKYKALCKQHQISYKPFMDFSHPGEYIVRVAKDNSATMIVMGTRGMGTFRRTMLGSVSDYIVHHSHCPILVAKK